MDVPASVILTTPGSALPPCTQYHVNKFLLLRGTGSTKDSLYAGFRTGPGTFAWALILTSGDDVVVDDLEINGALNHDGASIGFYNTAPIAKPTVTGSRGANAALASLCTALANLGLITDSTS